MTEHTESQTQPDTIGYGFAEIATLAAMVPSDATTASAEALRVSEYVGNPDMVAAGASSLVARGLATVETGGDIAVSGPTAAVAAALSSATRRMEISLITEELTDSVIGIESPDLHLLFQPRAYLTWWAMAQRPGLSGAEADFFIVREHLRIHPRGGATVRRREDASGRTLYIKNGNGSWTIGLSTAADDDVTETAGLDDAALLAQIRLIRQD